MLVIRLVLSLVAFFLSHGLAYAQETSATNRPLVSKGNAFNPDIGFNTLLLYRNSNRGNSSTSPEPNGFLLDESELQLASDVDAYFRAVALLSIHKGTTGWVMEGEEIYAETLSLPSVAVRFGKFRTAIGKYNGLHAHGLPFIDNQLINQKLFGGEGMSAEGVSVSGLLPAPWFSELTVQALNGQTEVGDTVELFKASSPNSTVGLGRWKNLWDLTEDLTMELGVSAANGPNDSQGAGEPEKMTSLWGGDWTFKWRPSVGGKYSALIWSTEYLHGQKNLNPVGEIRIQGASTFLQWQVAERWWVQARTEYATENDSIQPGLQVQRKNSALVAFLPTEFSGLRLQYDHLEDAAETPENRILFQFNFSIGAHPAHAY